MPLWFDSPLLESPLPEKLFPERLSSGSFCPSSQSSKMGELGLRLTASDEATSERLRPDEHRPQNHDDHNHDRRDHQHQPIAAHPSTDGGCGLPSDSPDHQRGIQGLGVGLAAPFLVGVHVKEIAGDLGPSRHHADRHVRRLIDHDEVIEATARFLRGPPDFVKLLVDALDLLDLGNQANLQGEFDKLEADSFRIGENN